MIVMLFGFWLALNGRIAPDTLLTGIAVTALVLAAAYFFGGWSFKKELTIYRLLPQGALYFAILMKEIFLANLQVIRLIFTKRETPCIRNYITKLKSKTARVVLANSITLTPGTVTVQLVDNVLTVHCLTHEMADALSDNAFEKRLLEMEDRVYGKHV